MKTIDISEVTESDDYFPCCLLCDNEILDWEETGIVIQHGAKALAHLMCIENEDLRP